MANQDSGSYIGAPSRAPPDSNTRKEGTNLVSAYRGAFTGALGFQLDLANVFMVTA